MQSAATAQQYLQSAIQTASPARLRLLLIERGAELARYAASQGAETPEHELAGTRLQLREILGELLDGITPAAGELGREVSDLYVFLLQHLARAEAGDDPRTWLEIAQVLQIEQETWQQVCATLADGPSDSDTGEAPRAEGTAPKREGGESAAFHAGAPAAFPMNPSTAGGSGGGLNLQV